MPARSVRTGLTLGIVGFKKNFIYNFFGFLAFFSLHTLREILNVASGKKVV